jgi:site-specific DNA recombinase
VRAGDIDVIVVYCLDRLGRDPTHGVILTQELEKHHVILEAVTETVDSSELGKLISYIRGFASKLETEKIRERTMRGKREYVRMGRLPIGTGKGLYGYKWDSQSKKRILLEFEVKVVEKIFTMLADGAGCFSIARTLSDQRVPTKTGIKWHQRTIDSILANPAYIDKTYYGKTRGSSKTKLVRQPECNWELLPDVTPPIVSEELFGKVQEMCQQDRELHRAKTKHHYLLRGHAVCGYCGSPLVGSFMNHRFRYYHCRGTYPTTTRVKVCSARYIRADYLEDAAWQSIRKVLENPQVVMSGVKEQLETEQKSATQSMSLSQEIQKLKRKIKSYDSQEKRLVKLFRYGEINQDSILDELNQLKKERETDKQKLEDYTRTKEHLENLELAEMMLAEYCQRLRHDLDNATCQEKKEILEMFDIKVTATPERIDIQGVIPLESTSLQ